MYFAITATVLTCAAWTTSHWQVLGVTAGSYSIASGPGGWEISCWETPDSRQLSFFTYSTTDETGSPSATPRLWGIFIYHWLIVSLLIFFSLVLAWIIRKDSPT